MTALPQPIVSAKVLSSLVLSLLCLFSTPAVAQSVSVELDASVDFSKFKTFVVRDGKLNSKSPALNSELTKKRIAAEIEKAFVEKGLTIATGQADLNVSFDFGSARILETKSYPAGWHGHGSRVVNVPQSEGTLVIDLHDAANALVWRSITVESEANPVKLADRIEKIIKKAIAKYPKLKAGKK